MIEVEEITENNIGASRKRYSASEIERFATCYVEHGNATQALREMRPNRNASNRTTTVEAMRLLKDVRFAEAIRLASIKLGTSSAITKSRLNEILTKCIEDSAKEGTLAMHSKLIDIVCKMNGFYEAQKIDVRHGAIDDESKMRALRALQDVGAEIVDADVVNIDGDGSGCDNILEDAEHGI